MVQYLHFRILKFPLTGWSAWSAILLQHSHDGCGSQLLPSRPSCMHHRANVPQWNRPKILMQDTCGTLLERIERLTPQIRAASWQANPALECYSKASHAFNIHQPSGCWLCLPRLHLPPAIWILPRGIDMDRHIFAICPLSPLLPATTGYSSARITGSFWSLFLAHRTSPLVVWSFAANDRAQAGCSENSS